MKNIIITLLLITSFLTIEAQTFVPDNTFEQHLIDLGLDDVLDNFVVTANINTITSLDANFLFISDFTGLEDFIALEVLRCAGNDISEINLNTLTNLKELEIWGNPYLQDLDISNNILLEILNCGDNYFNFLNTSNNVNLKKLFISNSFIQLDLTNNILLEIVDFDYTYAGINLSTNTALKTIYYAESGLSGINTSNMPNLEYLSINNNSIENLDLSNNSKLKELHCYFNNLTNLDVSNNLNLESLYCEENQLTNLTLGSLPLLQTIFCGNNNLTNINVTSLSSLEYINCDRNNLREINLLNNVNLKFFQGSHNFFTEIDTDSNIELEWFIVTSCNLTNIDISNNINLQKFACGFNESLTDLDLRNGNNQEINLYSSLDTPNLKCIFVDNIEYSNTNWISVDPNNHFVESQEQCDAIIGIENNVLNSLIIYPNPVKNTLIITNNLNINLHIEIFNILGKSIIKQQIINNNQNSIDISNLDKGIYILKYKNQIIKFIKH